MMKGEEDETTAKCRKCSRKARKGCTQSVCLKCCSDSNCSVHEEQRQQAAFREQILTGTTDVQRALQAKRSKLILKGRFREPGFTYMGDTVIIFSLKEYLSNPKWKEEALRKASKRRARDGKPVHVLRNSRKRFRRLVNTLYEKSLQT